MGALFLYATWSERRKKRKEFSTAEENEPLGDESRIISDCEKGVIEASKDKNKYDDDRMVRPPSAGREKFRSLRFHIDSIIAAP